MRRTTAFSTLRLVVQLVSFVLLPGLFVEAFSGLHVMWLAATGSVAVDATFWMQVMGTIVTVLVTALVGRAFCGWMCAFGTMQDLLRLLGGKAMGLRLPVRGSVDAALKWVKYVLLAGIVGLVWTGVVTVPASLDPWGAFAALLVWPVDLGGVAGAYPGGAVILAAVMALSLFVDRPFCRYLCPMGAAYGMASLARVGRIRKPRGACGRCRACTKSCSMGIDLGATDEVRSPECIDCMGCVAVCPRDNAGYASIPAGAAPVAAGIAVASVMGLYYVGNVGAGLLGQAQSGSAEQSGATQPATSTAATTSAATSASAATGWTDGTYTGSGTGHRGTVTVSVTVSGGKIVDIETVSTNDDAQYYNRAFSAVSQEIISQQTTDVDAVSGATHSSDGIMGAVANALAEA